MPSSHDVSQSNRIVRLLSSRWLERLKAKWWPRPQWQTGRCPNQSGNAGGLGVDNIAGFVLLLLAGIALAIVALIGEWLYYRAKRSRQQQLGDQETTNTTATEHNVILPTRNVATDNRRPKIGGSRCSPDVLKARRNIALCRQRRRRLSKSITEEEDTDPDAICVISSFN